MLAVQSCGSLKKGQAPDSAPLSPILSRISLHGWLCICSCVRGYASPPNKPPNPPPPPPGGGWLLCYFQITLIFFIKTHTFLVHLSHRLYSTDYTVFLKLVLVSRMYPKGSTVRAPVLYRYRFAQAKESISAPIICDWRGAGRNSPPFLRRARAQFARWPVSTPTNKNQ